MNNFTLEQKRAARAKLEKQFPGISSGISREGVIILLTKPIYPSEIDGVPIEVRYIGRVVAQ